MTRIRAILAAAALLTARIALAQAAAPAPRPPADAGTEHERRQALIENHMASEAALASAERASVVAVRADLTKNEADQRTAVRAIRKDYRARTGTMKSEHAAAKKALGRPASAHGREERPQ